MLKCSSCDAIKPYTGFTKRKDRPKGYVSACKVCTRENTSLLATSSMLLAIALAGANLPE